MVITNKRGSWLFMSSKSQRKGSVDRCFRKSLAYRFIGLLVCVFLYSGPFVGESLSADYPTRPVRLIVGFVPGGVADLLARGLGQALSQQWSQPVIIDNRSGGGGLIGMQLAAKSQADGYTLLMGSSTQFSITPALSHAADHDPSVHFQPVSQVALTPVILTVSSATPVRSLPDLIQWSRQSATSLSYGSTGYGGAPHIAAEWLKNRSGVSFTHVPFKGGGDSMLSLMGGHVQFAVGAVSTALPQLKEGRIRALGVTTSQRMKALPQVPTFIEQGFSGFDVEQWYGVFAPIGLPQERLKSIQDAMRKVLTTNDLVDKFNAQGVQLMASSPEIFSRYVKSELVRWTAILKMLQINEAP